MRFFIVDSRQVKIYNLTRTTAFAGKGGDSSRLLADAFLIPRAFGTGTWLSTYGGCL